MKARHRIAVGALLVAACARPDAGVDVIADVFPRKYALADNKEARFGVNLRDEVAELRRRAHGSDRTLAVFDFFHQLHDLHARPLLAKNDAVWLGFHIEGIDDGSYRVAWVDQGRTDLEVGDTVIELDGVPIASAVKHAVEVTGWDSTPAFAARMATKLLVYRARSDWLTIPKAGAEASVRVLHNGQERLVVLRWLDDARDPPHAHCAYWARDPKGVLPALGPIVWEHGSAYVFAHGDHNDGFIRYASYADNDDVLITTRLAIQAFANHRVRAVVIDQTGNGGGNFLFGYRLLAHFLARAVAVPRQAFLIDHGTIVGFENVAELNASHPGFLAQFIDEPAARHLTNPYPEGVSKIAPADDAFTGELVLLTSALDVSAAEYVAATLQDSGRAKIIGETTAGGGGDQRVIKNKQLRALGIEGFTYTVTVGVRSSGRLIENIGVAPDIEHTLTLRDLTEHGADYAQTVLGNIP